MLILVRLWIIGKLVSEDLISNLDCNIYWIYGMGKSFLFSKVTDSFIKFRHNTQSIAEISHMKLSDSWKEFYYYK